MEANTNDKKQHIVRSALKAFALYGLEGTTTRQIADIAGIGKSTIYEYFESKEALFAEAFHSLTALAGTDQTELKKLAQTDPRAALDAYLDNAESISLHQPELLLIISQFTLGILLRANRFESAKEAYRSRMEPLMQDIIRDLKEILLLGIERKQFLPAADLGAEELVYTLAALIREMQAQAFLLDGERLADLCRTIKRTVYKLLGI